MSRARWLRRAFVSFAICASAAPVYAWEKKIAEPPTKVTIDPRLALANEITQANEARAATIRKTLLTKTNVSADGVPLEAFLEKLAKQHGLQIVIDKPALADEGVVLDQSVSLQHPDITLRSALRLILAPLQLTTVIEDEALLVTTNIKAQDMQSTRVYDVSMFDPVGGYRALIDIITSCIQPESWPEVGGPSPIRALPAAQAIVLRHSEAVHDEIADLISELAQKVRHVARATDVQQQRDPIRDAELALRKRLLEKCDVAFHDQPLERAFQQLAEEHKIPLWIDRTTLIDECIYYDQTATIQIQDVRLESALRSLLGPSKLTWLVEDEVLKVTTLEKAAETLKTRIYDVGDLVVRTPQELNWPPFSSVSAGFGGTGGGFDSLPVRPLLQGFGNSSVPTTRASIFRQSWTSQKPYDFARLIDLLSTIEPDSWDEVGGPGSMRGFAQNVLVVRQTQAILEQMEAMLHRLRTLAAGKLDAPAKVEPEDPHALTLFVYHFTGDYSYSPEALAKLIPEVVARETWKPAGGDGTIIVQPTSLVIRQTPAVHKQIVKLLYDVVLQAK